jgi:hypothetical protein
MTRETKVEFRAGRNTDQEIEFEEPTTTSGAVTLTVQDAVASWNLGRKLTTDFNWEAEAEHDHSTGWNLTATPSKFVISFPSSFFFLKFPRFSHCCY